MRFHRRLIRGEKPIPGNAEETSSRFMNTPIDQLHIEYCRLIQGQLKLTLDRQYWWGQWKSRGFTMEDLRLVIGHLQRGIKDGKRYPGSLKWSHLIQQTDSFEEELNVARAEKRNLKPAPSPKAVAQQQFSPVVASAKTEDTAKPASYWIAKLRAAVDNPGSVSQ